MNETRNTGLLPNGLRDTLPPDADFESYVIDRLMAGFSSHGYDPVKPPLVEFEDGLLEGPGDAVAHRMFRLMDPLSKRMMGVRPDITPQIARIATSRLANAPRPLRLSYAGTVLQVEGNGLSQDREIVQAGVELIGSAALTADAEVILVAAEALRNAGITEPAFDLGAPALVPLVCAGMGLDDAATEQAREALDRKNTDSLTDLSEDQREVLNALLGAAGRADTALEKLTALELPPEAAALVSALAEVIGHVRAADPLLRMTVDPVEFRGLEYQTGISFTIFARGVRGELGRGGRYPLGTGETATGVTLFVAPLLRAADWPDANPCVYVPLDTGHDIGAKLRADGWRTVAALETDTDAEAEARRLGCSHVLRNNKPEALN
ncbi:MAG: ATP phosphoribosyltransferase regulatory subunit [Alphaproteobacteria bacterium]|jgi:ATP phosphoribosyltransferase regulatory subunit|nr:ATP phosphoribosyltransferase regulatory subunit [Alphaproteobacteria bacterium]MBT5860547.1 ATP phosphoribosyltransferase regulatory subunit [Alphaproteobacteria bacterium]